MQTPRVMSVYTELQALVYDIPSVSKRREVPESEARSGCESTTHLAHLAQCLRPASSLIISFRCLCE